MGFRTRLTRGMLGQANTSYLKGGFHPDGRDSFFVDYSTNEFLPFRIGGDEFRRVLPGFLLLHFS